MNTIDDKRGKLIEIARGFLSGDNHVICREDIPDLVDEIISEVKGVNSHREEIHKAFDAEESQDFDDWYNQLLKNC